MNTEIIKLLEDYHASCKLRFKLTVILLLVLAGCANDSADTSELSDEDAVFFCQAMEDWDFRWCYDDGPNPVIYDENLIRDRGAVGWAVWSTGMKGSWTISIHPRARCKREIFRHELGHAIFGYFHGEHPWVAAGGINC